QTREDRIHRAPEVASFRPSRPGPPGARPQHLLQRATGGPEPELYAVDLDGAVAKGDDPGALEHRDRQRSGEGPEAGRAGLTEAGAGDDLGRTGLGLAARHAPELIRREARGDQLTIVAHADIAGGSRPLGAPQQGAVRRPEAD